MANFTGNGGIDAFRVQPKGAGFEMVDYHGFVKGNGLLTDVDFGYDGKMYVSDWAQFQWDGGGAGKGRIYTVYDPKAVADPAIVEVKRLFANGFGSLSNDRLVELLNHADQRVRQRAQFTLATGGVKNLSLLANVAQKNPDQLARIHALWGMGQIAANRPDDPHLLSRETKAVIPTLLTDPDAEIRAQAAKIAARDSDFDKVLLSRLEDEKSLRVRFFVVQSLGQLRKSELADLLVGQLSKEPEFDPFLRHAFVHAIVQSVTKDDFLKRSFAEAKRGSSSDVDLIKILVHRAFGDPRVARYLDDPDPAVVLEAARAINDLPIEAAYPDLAKLSKRYAETPLQPDDALWRRIINAHFRLGGIENADALMSLAENPRIKSHLREEIVRCLTDWSQPPPRDRVNGYWRPLPARDGSVAVKVFRDRYDRLLLASSGSLTTAILQALTKLNIPVEEAMFASIVRNGADVEQRIGALNLLAHRKSKHLPGMLDDALAAGPPGLKIAARDHLAAIDPVRGRKELEAALEASNLRERQAAYRSLGALKAVPPLTAAMDKLVAGNLAPEVRLDVLVAAQKSKDVALLKLVDEYKKTFPKDDALAPYRIALNGGDADRGRALFWSHTTAQCVRCHKVKSSDGDLRGGDAGPNLSEWAAKGDRVHSLESLILPDKKITPGFGTVTFSLDDGRALTGILKSDDKDTVVLVTPDNKEHRLNRSAIESRSQPKSLMPAMGPVLSLDELRDVIEFLDDLRRTGAPK
ncbi:MAG: HEAT repeat domain-containing protein [Planctomycetota bacterium]